MQVAHADARLIHIFGEFFGHALGKRRHQHALLDLDFIVALGEKIVHLCSHLLDLIRRIDQPRRADHLLYERAVGTLQFPLARRSGNEHRLRAHRIPFFEFERAVIHAGRQAKPIFHQHGFTRMIAVIHPADLRHGNMAFIDKKQRVFRQILKQGRRRLARLRPGKIARIVFDALAASGFHQHFQIVIGTLLQPLRLDQLVGFI